MNISLKKLSVLSLLTVLFLTSAARANNFQAVQIYLKNLTNANATAYYRYNGQRIGFAYLVPGQTVTANSYLGVNWEIQGDRSAVGAVVTQAYQTIELKHQAVQPQRPIDPNQNLGQSGDSLNQAVLNYAQSVRGQRVGNGQCTELATQALRAAGARGPQGYNWGRKLGGTSELRPGDIIQLWNATFRYPDGSWSFAYQHTAVVTSVQGSVIHVLEQNMQGSPVQVGKYDVTAMQAGGRIDCYRPEKGGQQSFAGLNEPQPRFFQFWTR